MATCSAVPNQPARNDTPHLPAAALPLPLYEVNGHPAVTIYPTFRPSLPPIYSLWLTLL